MSAITTPELLADIADAVQMRRATSIATVNAEYVVRAAHEPAFHAVLERTSINTPDGFGVVWALRRRGFVVPARVGGSDLIWEIPEQASRLGHRVFFLGAAEGVAAETARRLQERFPDLKVAGCHAGDPSPSSDNVVVDLIRLARADIVFVAYGSPQQDLWIDRNLPCLGASVAIGVGGSFDYVAGIAVRAPHWMRERGLEWLWRLMRNPRRWRRMLALPRFVWIAWRSERHESIEGNIQ